jgi:hypothetical protein
MVATCESCYRSNESSRVIGPQSLGNACNRSLAGLSDFTPDFAPHLSIYALVSLVSYIDQNAIN